MFRRKPDMDPQKPGDDAADDLALALKPARPAMPSTTPMKPAAMPRAVSEPQRLAIPTKLRLDQAEWLVVGAAQTATAVLEYFAALGVPICELRGMSQRPAA